MNINLTLLGEMITFAIFVWFTMKFVWPPITKAMAAREKKIADGLADAEKAKRQLELAQIKSKEMLQDAKLQAAHLVDQANQRAMRLVEEAKETARKEEKMILDRAKVEADQAFNQAKQELEAEVVKLAVAMAEKILERDVDANAHKKLFKELVTEV